MRRKDREMTDRSEMETLLAEATVCRLGCDDNGRPYIVPVSFGYREGVIFIHSAHEGRKITLLQKNPECCIEVDECRGVLRDEKPCNWEMHYRSVICTGKAHFITDPEEKREGLNCIMHHYGAEPRSLSEKELISVCVIRIDVAEMTGKKYEG
ncbi:MAG: pyridoxamine 5'-phosphate oxidase family protein [Methanoregula sp.]|nr:pyridoxamine 5'-phosphate oxidase family protein [Methanoregula sp.]